MIDDLLEGSVGEIGSGVHDSGALSDEVSMPLLSTIFKGTSVIERLIFCDSRSKQACFEAETGVRAIAFTCDPYHFWADVAESGY